MTTYIALLRGINVGGKNSLPMKELVAVLEKLGAANVKTYIQSGNAVFESDTQNASTLCRKISAEVKQLRSFEPHVLLLKSQELEKAIENNPFPEAEGAPNTLHVGFLDSASQHPDLKKLESLKSASEEFRLEHKVFYLHTPDGLGRSKLAGSVEKVLGIPMTFRNWRTVCKLREMA